MADNHSEIHNRMSKKIAQLTKVIYGLHIRNEENKSFRQALTKAHDKEIDTILKDANRIVGRYKESLEKQKDQSDIKEKFNELEKEKSDSQNKFSEYKQQAVENEK